jgi:energy-coupling factor transporter ATP-binding protein EcfA2
MNSPDFSAKFRDLVGSPYPGLRSFEEADAPIFFGRERHTDEVLERIEKSNFVAVIGPSGCGKSSLIKAGVIPQLKAGTFWKAGANWRVALFRPGNVPFWNAATAVAKSAAGDGQAIDAKAINDISMVMSSDTFEVSELKSHLNLGADTNFLFVVDQFEEIFSTDSEAVREANYRFVDFLLRIFTGQLESVHCIITMRTDHLGECAQHVNLADVINKTFYLTPNLTEKELALAFEMPVGLRRFGGTMEPDLLAQLIRDMRRDPLDQLPLAQHVLRRMWLQASRTATRALTLTLYEKYGGLAGSLDQHGRQLLERLPPEGGAMAKHLFKQITERREGATYVDIRRPARVKTILDGLGDQGEAQLRLLIETIDYFRSPEALFLQPSFAERDPKSQPIDEETRIDIVHECLIRKWSSLRQWVQEEWASARELRNLITIAASPGYLTENETANLRLWKENAHPTAAWASRYGVAEEQFRKALAVLTKSIDHWHEAEFKKLLWRGRKWLYAAGTVLAAGIVAALVYFIYLTNELDYQNKRAKWENDIATLDGDYITTVFSAQKEHAELLRDTAVAAASDAYPNEIAGLISDLSGIYSNVVGNKASLEDYLSKREYQKLNDSRQVFEANGWDLSTFEFRRDKIALLRTAKYDTLDQMDQDLVKLQQAASGNLLRLLPMESKLYPGWVTMTDDGRRTAALDMKAGILEFHQLGQEKAIGQIDLRGVFAASSVVAMEFSSDGKFLVAAGSAAGGRGIAAVVVALADAATVTKVDSFTIDALLTGVSGARISLDSRLVAISLFNGTIAVCEIGRCATGLRLVSDACLAYFVCSLLPDERDFLAISSKDNGEIRLTRLDVSSTRSDGQLNLAAGNPAIFPSEQLPLYCRNTGQLILVDYKNRKLVSIRRRERGGTPCSMTYAIQERASGVLADPTSAIKVFRLPPPADWSPVTFKTASDFEVSLAIIDDRTQLVATQNFPFRVNLFKLSGDGRRLLTVGNLPGEATTLSPPAGSVWRLDYGENISAPDMKLTAGPLWIGYDFPREAFLLKGVDGLRAFSVISHDELPSGDYTFDEAAGSFAHGPSGGIIPAARMERPIEAKIESSDREFRLSYDDMAGSKQIVWMSRGFSGGGRVSVIDGGKSNWILLLRGQEAATDLVILQRSAVATPDQQEYYQEPDIAKAEPISAHSYRSGITAAAVLNAGMLVAILTDDGRLTLRTASMQRMMDETCRRLSKYDLYEQLHKGKRITGC